MPQPRKTLVELALIDRTFLARRHAELLVEEQLVDEPRLRRLQQAYREQMDGLERRRLALAFEKVVREPETGPELVELELVAKTVQADASDEQREAQLDDALALGASIGLEPPAGVTREQLQAGLDELMRLPPVPMELAHDRRLYERYWRARKAADLYDAGRKLHAVAAELGVSGATVLRDFAWLNRWNDAPQRWLKEHGKRRRPQPPLPAFDDVSDLETGGQEAQRFATALRIRDHRDGGLTFAQLAEAMTAWADLHGATPLSADECRRELAWLERELNASAAPA